MPVETGMPLPKIFIIFFSFAYKIKMENTLPPASQVTLDTLSLQLRLLCPSIEIFTMSILGRSVPQGPSSVPSPAEMLPPVTLQSHASLPTRAW